MNTFTRTSSGLNNQHLFFDVDYVVYLEGGKCSYTIEDVYDGKFSHETEDILFWGNIFKTFRQSQKFKFKSIGSKVTVTQIANQIISGNISNVIVAMDNEFDEILNKRLIHKNIYYTHGYSWENDVWSFEVITAIIEELTAIKINNDEIFIKFNELLDRIKIAVFADALLFESDSSFFPRKTGILFCMDCNNVDLPSINVDKIERRIIEKGLSESDVLLYGGSKSLNVLKFCYGHFLANYCCHLIMYYLKNKHGLSTISNYIIYRMSIKKHFDLTFYNGYTFNYYKQQFESKA